MRRIRSRQRPYLERPRNASSQTISDELIMPRRLPRGIYAPMPCFFDESEELGQSCAFEL